MKLSQEQETILANIGSLTDQLKQLQQGEEFDQDPELTDLQEEPDLEAIFVKLVDGEPLLSDELEALGEATAGSGKLIEDLVAKLASGQPLEPDEVALLKGALDGEGEELKAAEKVAAAIIERSLQGVSRQDAVPLLAGIRGPDREAGRLVRKRFSDWEAARADTSQDRDLVRLFSDGDSRVAKALPETLELMGRRLGVKEPEEDDSEEGVLQRAVAKMQLGEALTEEELAEISAANLAGRPLILLADMPVHKELRPFNRTRPVESLQETFGELKAMLARERVNVRQGNPMRGNLRRDVVRKGLATAIGTLFDGRV